jgi:hypothetical protein
MEKDMCHTFISLFLVQGRGGMGFIPLLQQVYISYNFPSSFIFCVLVPRYLVKLESFPSGSPVLLIQDSNRMF